MTDLIDTILHLDGPNFYEAYEVRTVRCYRHKSNGESQRVTVELLDAGPTANPLIRYSCRAVSEDGKRAGGHPTDSVAHALAIVQWDQLDDPDATNV